MDNFYIISLILCLIYGFGVVETCVQKDFGNDGTVCVCNATYCDTVPPVVPSPSGTFQKYTSSKFGLRFQKYEGTFDQIPSSASNIIIKASARRQTILGFGGAFSDSAGLNIASLNVDAQQKLMESYFSSDGIEYSMGRVPIGGTDFSTRPYTLDDVPGDITLRNFTLQPEDYNYKLPYVKWALNLTNNNMVLFTTAWTAPPWMKTSQVYSGISFLRREMYQVWANYLLRFLEEYEKEGISFWGMTTGNEPSNGYVSFLKINSMGWTPWAQSLWIGNNLGPTLNNSRFANVTLIAMDDQRIFLPWGVELLFEEKSAKQYIKGIGVHWYLNAFSPSSVLTKTHDKFPDKFILATEACEGSAFFQKHVALGSWARGENYMRDIVQNMENWVTGWMDWNIALDMTGGPTYIENIVDSPIIVNADDQEFYKQPMFYAMGHFSKFVPRGSVVVEVTNTRLFWGVFAVAFLRPDGGTTVVLYNRDNSDYTVRIYDERVGTIVTNVAGRSFASIVYW